MSGVRKCHRLLRVASDRLAATVDAAMDHVLVAVAAVSDGATERACHD
jgi:hypothetical protein